MLNIWLCCWSHFIISMVNLKLNNENNFHTQHFRLIFIIKSIQLENYLKCVPVTPVTFCRFTYIRLCNLRSRFYSHTLHHNDIIISAMASQIINLTSVYSGVDQRKHQSSASVAFVWEIHRWPVNSLHKWPVTRTMFPFDDVIMFQKFEWRDDSYCSVSFQTVL